MIRPPLRAALLAAASSLAFTATAFSQDAPTASAVEAVEPDRPASVSVTSVTLSTGGLAEVEGRMTEADDAMSLSIERPQIADVLRTLVVTGSAPVVSIDLEAAEPVGERSVVGQLLAGDLSDPATVLRSLIGEEVALSGGPNRLVGTLLAFESVRIPAVEDGQSRPGYRVAVATPEGRIAYATFATLDQLAIEGDAVDERMAALAPAVGRNVDDGRRELTVTLGAEAEAGFSFVVPTTVWRPSYRALVSDDGEVTLQGWATLENTTGLDWEEVELRLAVGTPVAYRQDVYSPLRTQRPVAPFMVGETARTGLVENAPALEAEAAIDAFNGRGQPRMAAAPQATADMAIGKAASLQTGGPAIEGTATSVFPVANRVDLAAGRTLSVPFLDTSDNVARIAYLDLADDRRPLDALEMTFEGRTTVPGGLVAVFDGRGFAGDARFAGADGGEAAILPFALSSALNVTTEAEFASELTDASLSGGALILTREARETTRLSLDARDAVDLVLDGARQGGSEIAVEAADGVRTVVTPLGPQRYRVRAELPAGESTLTLIAARPIEERYVVSNLPLPVIEEVRALGDRLDDATRDRLDEIVSLTRRIGELDRSISAGEADAADLREALETDRDNLRAIDVRTPEGARVRQRIIERSNLLDATLDELRELRRQRLDVEAELNGG